MCEIEFGMKLRATHTFIDVVDNCLGTQTSSVDIARLNQGKMEDLADLLLDFYDAWSPPPPTPGEIRVFVETERVRFIDWQPGHPMPRPPLQHLLYVDSLAIEDPVAESVALLRGRIRGAESWTLARHVLALAIDSFRACQPLLSDGSLILVPGPHLVAAFEENGSIFLSAIHECRPHYEETWHEQTGLARREIRQIATDLFPHVLARGFEDGSYDFAWEEWGLSEIVTAGTDEQPYFEYEGRQTINVIRSLSAAVYTSAKLLPNTLYSEATHRAILATLGDRGSEANSSLEKINPALASGTLPMFAGVPITTLVDIRRNEPAFAAWRSELRNAARLIRQSPSEPGFSAAAQETLKDTLTPSMQELHRVASLNSRLRSGLKPATIAFALGAVAGSQGGVDLATSLAAAGTTSAAGLALRALFPDHQPGMRAVLLRLLPYASSRDPDPGARKPRRSG